MVGFVAATKGREEASPTEGDLRDLQTRNRFF